MMFKSLALLLLILFYFFGGGVSLYEKEWPEYSSMFHEREKVIQSKIWSCFYFGVN